MCSRSCESNPVKQDFHENRLLQDLASIQRREYSGFGKEEEKKRKWDVIDYANVIIDHKYCRTYVVNDVWQTWKLFHLIRTNLGKKIFKAEVSLILTDREKDHWYDNFEHHM